MLAKGGGETESYTTRFTKGPDVSASTSPVLFLAKLLHQKAHLPFRRFQILGRAGPAGPLPSSTRRTDVIGDGRLDITNEAEILHHLQDLTSSGSALQDPGQQPGSTNCHPGPGKQAGDVMRTIDKLEKIGPEKVRAILTDDSPPMSGTPQIPTCPPASNGRYPPRGSQNELFDQVADTPWSISPPCVPQNHFTVGPSPDYTGTVYKTTMLEHPEIGSICSGGRYR